MSLAGHKFQNKFSMGQKLPKKSFAGHKFQKILLGTSVLRNDLEYFEKGSLKIFIKYHLHREIRKCYLSDKTCLHKKLYPLNFRRSKRSFVKMSDRLLIAQIGSFEFPK